MRGKSEFRFLPKDTSACRWGRLGIELPTFRLEDDRSTPHRQPPGVLEILEQILFEEVTENFHFFLVMDDPNHLSPPRPAASVSIEAVLRMEHTRRHSPSARFLSTSHPSKEVQRASESQHLASSGPFLTQPRFN
ncbi:unnamed protein product [Pleuronectes platessa]|uniref:Uncharacterized protein n=1 Tax=Pleuronectes platessa TaxID=8262 RepID=A0A9N7U6Z3_PLEPL|nr:unnamed protein product [Pleuronectes platessa]